MKMHVYLNKLVNNKRYIRSFIDFGFHLVMYSLFYSKLLILELSSIRRKSIILGDADKYYIVLEKLKNSITIKVYDHPIFYL